MTQLSDINNNFSGYQKLITFYNANKDKIFDTIAFQITGCFAANMSTALGAILDNFTSNFNGLKFDYISPAVETILLKNDFLTFYGFNRIHDEHHTTIRFLKLKLTDGKYFKGYVINELIGRTELPQMSALVKEKMAEAIYEIFVNAQIHSESKNIYTCGQFFPEDNRMEFTIVDTGIGFKRKINERFNATLSAVQAIKWATLDKTTTKIGVSGGIGLALLKEVVTKNRGCLQIVSDDGFYEFSSNGEVERTFSGSFPGTIVNLQFRTNESTSYVLQSEVDLKNIF